MKEGRIARYLTEIQAWGARMNLVGSTDPEALERHVEDSLAAAELLPRGARVVDLGSGAGFPGIPLAIARPDLELTLVDIRERRVHFLRHVTRALQLSCTVERRRIEGSVEDPRDYALLRAVASPAVSVELARPWVAADGEIWIWAGPAAALAPLEGQIPLASGGRVLRAPAR